MENKELQEVVDAITDAILAMEQRISKRFDEVEDSFESLKDEVKEMKFDIRQISLNLKKSKE